MFTFPFYPDPHFFLLSQATVNVINMADWYHLHMYVSVAGIAPCLPYILMQLVAGC